MKAHELLLKLHFVQEESCCQILLKADASAPDLQFAAGHHCTQAVAEGIWAVAGVTYGQPLCPLQGCPICLCGTQSAADAAGRYFLQKSHAEHVQGWCHPGRHLCSCSCWRCLLSAHSISIQSDSGYNVDKVLWHTMVSGQHAEHVQGWCHLGRHLCNCSCCGCPQSNHSISVQLDFDSSTEEALLIHLGTITWLVVILPVLVLADVKLLYNT